MEINADVIILGAGAAGLFTALEYQNRGLGVILMNYDDNNTQTHYSQGIIHSGTKYELYKNRGDGRYDFRTASDLWESYLSGQGTLDLSGVDVLSQLCALWPQDYAALLAIKGAKNIFNSLIQQSSSHTPSVNFCGKEYHFKEKIIDAVSLINKLKAQFTGKYFNLNSAPVLIKNESNAVSHLIADNGNKPICFTANRYVFCCGKGNGNYWDDLENKKSLQLRPLHTVTITGMLPLLNGHIVSRKGIVATITTKTDVTGIRTWSIGGNVSEASSAEETQKRVEDLISRHIKLGNSEYINEIQIQKVIRAEGVVKGGMLPQGFNIYSKENYIFCWPVKLVLAPLMAKAVVKHDQKVSFHA